MGVAQMEKLPWLVERKRALAKSLSERLASIPGIRTPSEPKWGGHIYQSYVILVDKNLDRDKIVDAMKERGIETTLGTYALHDQPFFQREFGYKPGQLPNSHTAFMRTITLPLYPQMSDADINLIATALRSVVTNR